MKRISILAGLAVLAALSFSVTGVASASPSTTSVSAHVQQAIDALQDFQAAVRHGDDAAARSALRRNHRQTAVAARLADALNGNAGASATQRVARLEARNLNGYVGMFPLAGADLQLDLTDVIGHAVDACGEAADAVEAAADYVPSAAHDQVLAAAQAIRDACASAFPDGTTPADLTTQAIQACHDAIAQWNTFVDHLLASVPADLPFASFLGDISGTVTNLLHQVTSMADSACDMLGGVGTNPGAGVMGIFGSWLGGTGSGTDPLSGILSSLFGDSSGSGPLGSLGNLFGGFDIGNLLGGLFGRAGN